MFGRAKKNSKCKEPCGKCENCAGNKSAKACSSSSRKSSSTAKACSNSSSSKTKACS